MSELALGQLKGLTVNSNKITVPSGHTLYAPGHVIQATSASFTTTFSWGAVNSWVDLTGITVTITPKSSNSKFMIFLHETHYSGYTDNVVSMKIQRNGADIFAESDFRASPSYSNGTIVIPYLDSPNTSSTITYKAQVKQNQGSTGTYITSATMTVMEIAA